MIRRMILGKSGAEHPVLGGGLLVSLPESRANRPKKPFGSTPAFNRAARDAIG